MSKVHDLPNLLRAAAERFAAMSPAERERMFQAQRRSYVLGEIGMGSDKDEAAYRTALEAGDHATLVRLTAEAEARMGRAKTILDGAETAPCEHSPTTGARNVAGTP